PLHWPAHTEKDTATHLRQLLDHNQPARSFIGMGYHDTLVPAVIQRNLLENPGWYTAYTPYQAEVSQGRMEALLNFQQMTMDLTGLEMACASLLDEATAAAEALSLALRVTRKKDSRRFFVDSDCHPQTIDVVRTRAEGLNLEMVTGPASQALEEDVFGVLLACPGTWGHVSDHRALIASLKQRGVTVSLVADIMSLVLLEAPGHWGADVVLGSAQRFGVPMGYGGPHAAFFATRSAYKRSLPGRVIGVSVDSRGRTALRMALQTREQHIRREKATSNICTAQALLANMASSYAVYHGPEGLRTIAHRIHRLTSILALGFRRCGLEPVNSTWFDTLTLTPDSPEEIVQRCRQSGVCLREAGSRIGISLDEATRREDIVLLWDLVLGEGHGLSADALDAEAAALESLPTQLLRQHPLLPHPVFNSYQSETGMMRYLRRLEGCDLALNQAMIPLGSCTMKLNAAFQMMPVSWPQLSQLHPFTPLEMTSGIRKMIAGLESYLKDITGFDGICMQPNSGAQGEYAGLLAIRRYHDSRGESERTLCLIPASAHGTNPASASMAGMEVAVVRCDDKGNVDLQDLTRQASEQRDKLACLMITYPSTHGVYEDAIKDICRVVHEHGGQVYMDGANLNALVGVSRPADMGADVSHMNLHKTFSIPHGGGGPGMGPIGFQAHLAPFVPGHSVIRMDAPGGANTAVSAAPWGSASILPISWSYLHAMGGEGLKKATSVAILAANYLAERLRDHYPILYTGRNRRVAHECILDIRPIKAVSGITEEDIAKRLMDYGFHAPTMSFPVPGTLMVEPTESENLAELDRFVTAMVAIRAEIAQVERGEMPADNNPLVRAPHTQDDLLEEWDRPYSRRTATHPVPFAVGQKFWPVVNRVDHAHGERNLFCACVPVEAYSQ
ncbi:MAG: aminomethyl-transferring glycine dehydrogenase, partial [Kistimonas sp.]|nr:aminomethyl-transferring glycine dehydrogenase [Kistimonas sp.]